MSKQQRRVADVVRRAIADSVDRLFTNEAGALSGNDDEAVHQARVATRRLRSDLRTFKPFLDAAQVTELRGELRWLGAELGVVRDLDVLRSRLHSHAARLPDAEHETTERVIRRLDADRQAAGRDLAVALQSARYAQLRTTLVAAADNPPFVPASTDATARDVEQAVHAPWKKLRKAVRKLGDEPPDEGLHRVRIRAKHVRYAAEATAPLFGKPVRRFAKSVATLQDILGEHHDSVVAGTWLAKTAHECATTEAYAIGMLAQVEREFGFAARAAFEDAWDDVRAAHARAWK